MARWLPHSSLIGSHSAWTHGSSSRASVDLQFSSLPVYLALLLSAGVSAGPQMVISLTGQARIEPASVGVKVEMKVGPIEVTNLVVLEVGWPPGRPRGRPCCAPTGRFPSRRPGSPAPSRDSSPAWTASSPPGATACSRTRRSSRTEQSLGCPRNPATHPAECPDSPEQGLTESATHPDKFPDSRARGRVRGGRRGRGATIRPARRGLRRRRGSRRGRRRERGRRARAGISRGRACRRR